MIIKNFTMYTDSETNEGSLLYIVCAGLGVNSDIKTCFISFFVGVKEIIWPCSPLSTVYRSVCMQLTKTYMAEMFYNQLLLIDLFCIIFAHQDLFTSCHNIAMSLYNITEDLNFSGGVAIKDGYK